MEKKSCNIFFSNCCKEDTAGVPVTNATFTNNEYNKAVNENANEYTYAHDNVYDNNYVNDNIYVNKDRHSYINTNNSTYEDNGKIPMLNVKGDQPVFNVPIYQDKYIRDKIIEMPNYEIQDVIQPKLFNQETRHDVPSVELVYHEKKISIPQEQVIEKNIEIEKPIGYKPIYSPTWDVREVPRPIPKYEGEQKTIEVEVPQIKYVDKYIEKEIVVDVKEKIVPKITEIEKQVDVIKYQWKEQYQDVEVCKYVPKIDIELDCPPPLIVPYPEANIQNTYQILNPNQKAADVPSEILLKNTNIYNIDNEHVNESIKKSLLDVVRLHSQNKQQQKQQQQKKRWPFCAFSKCNNENNVDQTNEIDPQTGYPKSMPKDFAAFFKKDLNTVKRQMYNYGNDNSMINNNKTNISNERLEKSPVTPTIEYLGKVNKPPIDGGKLDSISFKLHAIEVHQFIPIPNLPKPKFLDIISPEKFEQNDISDLQNVFGSSPEGWVDPKITGFIAPMMHDILHGNVQPQNILFNKISIQANNVNGSTSNISISPYTHDQLKKGEEYIQNAFSSNNRSSSVHNINISGENLNESLYNYNRSAGSGNTSVTNTNEIEKIYDAIN